MKTTNPDRCPKRHAVKGEWSVDRREDMLEIKIQRSVRVQLRNETRAVYPTGPDSPACCIETRRVVRVVGEITDNRQLAGVAKELARHRGWILPARQHRRTAGRKARALMARALTPRQRTEASVRDGFGGDTFRRRFDGDVAQCGCRWERRKGFGDVLVECPLHAAAGRALLEKFERERSG